MLRQSCWVGLKLIVQHCPMIRHIETGRIIMTFVNIPWKGRVCDVVKGNNHSSYNPTYREVKEIAQVPIRTCQDHFLRYDNDRNGNYNGASWDYDERTLSTLLKLL